MNWQDAILAQGCFVSLVLAVGWVMAGLMRRRELIHQSRALTGSSGGQVLLETMAADGQTRVGLPRHPVLPQVALIMPVKGCRPHSLSNWESLLKLQYDGVLEYLFVLDSQDDAAWPALQHLKAKYPLQNIKVLTAGRASSCSQKIHNLVAGIQSSSPGSQYVLLLDDDVELHPACLHQLVATMQADTTLFMATGYPFDLPTAQSTLATYCVLVYHLPLSIAFSVRQRTSFVWGGCMMLRRANLVPDDAYQVMQTWCDGGYSDDLLLAALCGRQGLAITAPSYAVFPQWLDGCTSWSQYLNYLHRQLYVLDTYNDPQCRALNHTMMAVHSWASAAWAGSALVGMWQIGASLLQMCRAAASPITADGAQHDSQSRIGPLANSSWLVGFATCVLAAQLSLMWMTGQVLQLLLVLNPESKVLHRKPWQHFSYVKIWVAMLIESLLVPCMVVYTLSCPSVHWAGLRYHKHRGRVRLDDNYMDSSNLQHKLA